MPTAVASRDIFVQANGLRHHLIAGVHPGVPEVPGNTIDDDCDGARDETFELRGGIDPLGSRISSAGYRISRPQIEGTGRACSASWCITGGIVAGDLHPRR
jgi:hypothetical protein